MICKDESGDLVSVDEPAAAEMMVQSRPEHSRTQVNAAGATLIDPAGSLNDLRRARAIINNWRAAHSLPLDRIRMELQERVAPLGEGGIGRSAPQAVVVHRREAQTVPQHEPCANAGCGRMPCGAPVGGTTCVASLAATLTVRRSIAWFTPATT